jgi:RHS repeat-associated protein
LAETDANGATQRWFVYGNYIDEPLMMVAKCLDNTDPSSFFAHTLYYVQDALYSTRALVAYRGWVIEEQTAYDVYGNPLTWTSGDADADRDIDSGDSGKFMASRLESKCDPNYNWRCDINYDSIVNILDQFPFMPPRYSSTPANQQSFFTNPYYFTGRRVDLFDDGNLQLQDNRHRHYDYYTGRWLTHDPMHYVDGMNLYEYVQSKPLILTDPGGTGPYSFGDTCPPHPPPDPGAGPHAVDSPPNLSDWLYHEAWSKIAWSVRRPLPDASRHMKHYLGNTGNELTVRVDVMVRESPKATKHYYGKLNEAMDFVEKNVGCGKTLSIVGRWTGAKNTYSTSKNWFCAVGGYSACGSGRGTYIGSCSMSKCLYDLEFTYHFWDRYNWDVGKGVKFFGIINVPDTSLGKLHKEGIAQEFDMSGEVTIGVRWEKGQRFDESGKLTPGSSRRRCRR